MTINTMEVTRHDTEVRYSYQTTKKDGTYTNTGSLRSPLSLMSKKDMPVNFVARLMETFDTWTPKISTNDKIKFKSNEEKESHIQKLKDAHDPYTMYIDSYKQQKSAEAYNDYLENEIKFIEEFGYVPRTINKNGFRTLIEQTFSVLEGLEERSDKFAMATAIRWIKKLGFKEAHVDAENQVAYYTFRMLGTRLEKVATMCYEVKKVDEEYKVRFFYDTVSIDRISKDYGEIYDEKNLNRAEKLRASSRGYMLSDSL
jgi:hypothetical protein